MSTWPLADRRTRSASACSCGCGIKASGRRLVVAGSQGAIREMEPGRETQKCVTFLDHASLNRTHRGNGTAADCALPTTPRLVRQRLRPACGRLSGMRIRLSNFGCARIDAGEAWCVRARATAWRGDLWSRSLLLRQRHAPGLRAHGDLDPQTEGSEAPQTTRSCGGPDARQAREPQKLGRGGAGSVGTVGRSPSRPAHLA